MFKEAFLFGFGMVVDLSGSHFLKHVPSQAEQPQAIFSYWQRVGDLLRSSTETARPQIEAEASQMHLTLGD